MSGNSYNSSIVGGFNNIIINSCGSSIIGGSGLMLSGQDNTVLVPNLMIWNLPDSDPGIPGALYFTGTSGAYSLMISNPIRPSDFRFKNILKKLFITPEGINIYSFIYKSFMNIEGIFQGVIAQELMGSPFENALIKYGKYYYVNYYKLPGVEFKRIDW